MCLSVSICRSVIFVNSSIDQYNNDMTSFVCIDTEPAENVSAPCRKQQKRHQRYHLHTSCHIIDVLINGVIHSIFIILRAFSEHSPSIPKAFSEHSQSILKAFSERSHCVRRAIPFHSQSPQERTRKAFLNFILMISPYLFRNLLKPFPKLSPSLQRVISEHSQNPFKAFPEPSQGFLIAFSNGFRAFSEHCASLRTTCFQRFLRTFR